MSSTLKQIFKSRDPRKGLQVLIKNGLSSRDEVEEFLASEIKIGNLSIKSLDKFPFISKKGVLNYLSKLLSCGCVDLDSIDFNYSLAMKVPLQKMKKHLFIPISESGGTVRVAISDPLDIEAEDFVNRFYHHYKVELQISLSDQISEYLKKLELEEGINDVLKNIKNDVLNQVATKNNSAIIELINIIIKRSIDIRSSDIHIEPNENSCIVRNRVDGVLIRTFIFEQDIYPPLSSRLKLLANLDIAEKRNPQDGRFSHKIAGEVYDFRVSTLPIIDGESIVIRILDTKMALMSLKETGMVEGNYKRLFNLLSQSYGLLLVTGPTGSGKTTTLYGSLNEIKSVKDKIITVEDPIEYKVDLIQQVQVNRKAGLDFAKSLKAILRQDPDKIMIGEIRDRETLSIAVQSALTGHLVLSTLHTNDSISSINRMLDIGIEAYLLGGALIGVQAQRLVRKICHNCKTEYEPDLSELPDEVAKEIGEKSTLYRGTGCKTCSYTGFYGREMICEVLVIDQHIASLISSRSGEAEILESAKSNGFKTMFQVGMEKVLLGKTTIDEVLRVTKF
jgi:general secretion pathway protein E